MASKDGRRVFMPVVISADVGWWVDCASNRGWDLIGPFVDATLSSNNKKIYVGGSLDGRRVREG